jgi:prepilin-type N-terminal cleavage/methylation domain-containing protein
MSGNAMKQRGFTLIEIMVSVAILSVVITVAVGAILAIENVSRNARATQALMDNVSFAIENMVREMRLGTTYHCGPGDITETADCVNGDTNIAFLNSDDQEVEYKLYNGVIERSDDVGFTFFPVTSSGITIDTLKFYVTGSYQGDSFQPQVIIVVSGSMKDAKAQTVPFTIQTVAIQRNVDS